jgi:hypothetical protein
VADPIATWDMEDMVDLSEQTQLKLSHRSAYTAVHSRWPLLIHPGVPGSWSDF